MKSKLSWLFLLMIVMSLLSCSRPGGNLAQIFRISVFICGVIGLAVSQHFELKKRAALWRQQAEDFQAIGTLVEPKDEIPGRASDAIARKMPLAVSSQEIQTVPPIETRLASPAETDPAPDISLTHGLAKRLLIGFGKLFLYMLTRLFLVIFLMVISLLLAGIMTLIRNR